MQLNRISIIESLAINCSLSLKQFCKAMQKHFGLPDFNFDFENETEWGCVEVNGIEYNISRPYKAEILREWDETVPQGCNFSVSLEVSQEFLKGKESKSELSDLLIRIGQGVADLFNRDVYYHRTWLGVGNNVTRNQIFHPIQRNI